MADISLTKAENTAFQMLQATGEIQKIARPDGTVALDDLRKYFQDLCRKLEYSHVRRSGDYIDVEKVSV